MASQMVTYVLRGLEFFWTLLIMSITGNIIAIAIAGNPSVINFDMFVALFAMLSLFYIFAVLYNDGLAGHPLLPTIVDALNVFFWFCAAIAMAAELGVHSCSNGDYTASNKITNGSHNRQQRCQEAQAVTAFLWFGWLCWTASLVLTFVGGGRANLRGGVRKGGPAQMSQV